MKKNLILRGEIGCGKSTLIRNALGADAVNAGGYVTLRCNEDGKLAGFCLAPAGALADTSCLKDAQRFLDFTGGTKRNDSVFSGLGAALLKEALSEDFAIADEFGGLELLIPEFSDALLALLRSETPCIGVMKTEHAKDALIRRVHPGEDYERKYREFRSFLENDPDTTILETTGRYDTRAEELIARWTQNYVRK